MRRISVVGTSGAGKTTTARRLARALGAPFLELDSLHWQADWTPADPRAMRTAVSGFLTGESWVVDGNYRGVLGTLVWDHADTVVWVDLGRPHVMWQATRRTLARVLTRRMLWNGNREPLSNLLRPWGQDSILRWAWSTHPTNRARYLAAMGDPAFAHLTFVRLRTRREISRFLRQVADGPCGV